MWVFGLSQVWNTSSKTVVATVIVHEDYTEGLLIPSKHKIELRDRSKSLMAYGGKKIIQQMDIL